jgi:CDP-diacylglycerol--glycerol-3-phosphate 3-phosphatidyltransferase
VRGLPNALSLFRIAMVPVLGVLAWRGEAGLFLGGLALALASDVLDGIVARSSGEISPLGARLDSAGDLATFGTLPLFAWWLWPEILKAESSAFLVAIVAYLSPLVAGWLRFRRMTSYHTWAAKGTAVWMGGALFALFWGGVTWPFYVGVGLLVIEALEEIAITCVLPRWQADVPTFWHARRARGEAR